MSPVLIYVLGPSGAGKDSVLEWLKAHLPPNAGAHFARRCITRAAHPGAEQHEPMTRETFAAARDAGSFGLCWSANGLDYGVRHAELQGPPGTGWVFVTGSRAYLPQAIALFPGLVVLHVTASPEVLLERLVARGRESASDIRARLERAPPLERPAGTTVLEIHNNARLQDAGHQLELALGFLPGWPVRAQKSLR
ncbi:MAG: phosphonate metabolism protein/1,5-bisphosphokinase (PRPP-forming) PhnN [Betaproteobacteria bacterium]|nr:phosphonate metabolism protein/1,5-bisphosphokinase (PRPP-forming) PhnN [Betaproteobacteria bacterium]